MSETRKLAAILAADVVGEPLEVLARARLDGGLAQRIVLKEQRFKSRRDIAERGVLLQFVEKLLEDSPRHFRNRSLGALCHSDEHSLRTTFARVF